MGSPFSPTTSSGGAGDIGTTVGSTVGTAFGPVGTVAGGVIGGLAGNLIGGGGGPPKTWNGGRGSVGSHRKIMEALLLGKRWHDADAEELWWISTGGTAPEKHVAGTLEAKHGPQLRFDPIRVSIDDGTTVVVGTGNDSGRTVPRRAGTGPKAPNYGAGLVTPGPDPNLSRGASGGRNFGAGGDTSTLLILGAVAVVVLVIVTRGG